MGQLDVLAAAARAGPARQQVLGFGLVTGPVIPFGFAGDDGGAGVGAGGVVVVEGDLRFPTVIPAWGNAPCLRYCESSSLSCILSKLLNDFGTTISRWCSDRTIAVIFQMLPGAALSRIICHH